MLKIRLQRVGRKHEPVFRLVLTDSKNSPKSGRTLETLGSYDSRRGDKAEFNSDRITHWMKQGAQVSETVHNLLVDKKIVSGKKINVLPKKSPIAKEGAAAATPADVAPVVEAAPAPEVVAEAPVEAAPAPEETPAA